MPEEVTDFRSNAQDQIANAARAIGRSRDRRRVFEVVYTGKKKTKTVAEIAKLAGMKEIRVLQEGGKLADLGIVTQTKVGGKTAYEKDKFFKRYKDKILGLAGNTAALAKFHTKVNPKLGDIQVSVSFPKKMARAEQITIDDIDSFAKVRDIVIGQKAVPVYEEKIKDGLQKILGEVGTFQDWGGEPNDLFSTNLQLKLKGDRKNVAFGLKGKGTSGILTPKKMGKRGDQIQRLFKSPADVFLIQYWGQIDESVIDQMKQFAIAKSVLEDRSIYYGTINGQDTIRLVKGYPEHFNLD